MCNLYNHKVTRWELAAYYEAIDDWQRDLEKDYTSPGREGWVVTEHEGTRRLTVMNWGFPPPPNVKGPVVNLRNFTSPFWRSALANPERRCLVPVTRFQEWSFAPDPATGKKRPHWFTVPSQPIFTFAGIWRPTDTGPVFAFLTCGYEGDPSTHIVGAIHPKAMPVILHQENYADWLNGQPADKLAAPFPSQLLSVE